MAHHANRVELGLGQRDRSAVGLTDRGCGHRLGEDLQEQAQAKGQDGEGDQDLKQREALLTACCRPMRPSFRTPCSVRLPIGDQDTSGEPVDAHLIATLAALEDQAATGGAAIGKEADAAKVFVAQLISRSDQLDIDAVGQGTGDAPGPRSGNGRSRCQAARPFAAAGDGDLAGLTQGAGSAPGTGLELDPGQRGGDQRRRQREQQATDGEHDDQFDQRETAPTG